MGNTELIRRAKDLLYQMTYDTSYDACERLGEARDVIECLVAALESADKDFDDVLDTVAHLTEQINAFEEGLSLDNESQASVHHTYIPVHYTHIPFHYTYIPGEVRYVTTTTPQEVKYYIS